MISRSIYEVGPWCEMQSSRFAMMHFPIPVKFGFEPDPQMLGPRNSITHVRLRLTIRTMDRQNGAGGTLITMIVRPWPAPWTWQEDYLARMVFDSVREMMVHEVSEAFHVDGKRVFDPHVGEPGYVPEHAQPEPPPWYRGEPGGYREAPRSDIFNRPNLTRDPFR